MSTPGDVRELETEDVKAALGELLEDVRRFVVGRKPPPIVLSMIDNALGQVRKHIEEDPWSASASLFEFYDAISVRAERLGWVTPADSPDGESE